jgi:hypothetical protein
MVTLTNDLCINADGVIGIGISATAAGILVGLVAAALSRRG